MENLNKRPSKGILRFSESSRSESIDKDIKWDETNIKETLHPNDKDYGHMKIDEPPTPYSRSPHGMSSENSDDEDLEARTHDLLERVSKKIKEPPVAIENIDDLLDENDIDAIEKQDLDEEQISVNGENGEESTIAFNASTSRPRFSSNDMSSDDGTSPRTSKKNANDFELKRKRHYNEYHAVKLAKRLMEIEQDEDNDEDEDREDVDDHDFGDKDDFCMETKPNEE